MFLTGTDNQLISCDFCIILHQKESKVKCHFFIPLSTKSVVIIFMCEIVNKLLLLEATFFLNLTFENINENTLTESVSVLNSM